MIVIVIAGVIATVIVIVIAPVHGNDTVSVIDAVDDRRVDFTPTWA